MGKYSADDSPFAKPVTFTDPIERSKAMVDILKNREKVDLVICLSHSGTSKFKRYSEDEILAREVPGIDVIISAHTHTVLPKPIILGKTIIASAGCYGAYLGMLDLEYSRKNGTELVAYKLEPVSADVSSDASISSEIASYKGVINQRYLRPYHYLFDQAIAESGFDMNYEAYGDARSTETGLGDMITDAFRYAVQKAEGNKYEYIHLVIEPAGLIRDSFLKGNITVADIFKTLSIGLGEDGSAGYPLIACYITGDDMKRLLEVDTTVAKIKTAAHLQVSGIRFTYNPHRVPCDRVMSIEIRDANGNYQPFEPGKLYRICMSIYTAQMVDYMHRVSLGLITIHPKDKNGNPITDLKKARIDADHIAPGVQELKEWVALAEYMKSFPDTDGKRVPNVPLRYRAPEGRIMIQPSWNPVEMLRGGTIITYGIVIGGIIFLLVIGLAARAIVRRLT
jgi:2',3'-cyclic-nucleotide 2'-phosphodiesterase (5'-nucleotidase family)